MPIQERPKFEFGIPFPEESPRLVSICGDIPSSNEAPYNELDKFLLYLMRLAKENNKDPITLLVSSDGGDVATAKMITDYMSLVPFPIYTVTRGASSSAASLISISGDKGHRYIFKNSDVVLHLSEMARQCPGYGWPKKYCGLQEVSPSEEEIARVDRYIADIILRGTDGKLLGFLEDWDGSSDEEKRMQGMLKILRDGICLDSKGAVRHGLADHIIDKKIFKELFLT